MIRLNIPFTDHRELEEIAKVMPTGFFTQGPRVAEFEKLAKEFVNVKHALATSSCTTALHLSLMAAGVKAGDEVLVSDYTFPATGNVIAQIGAVPILVDIEPEHFTMDVQDLKKKLTKKSRAIMPVHAFGCSVDMDPILEVGNELKIPVIEDAACAFGTLYKGQNCGTMGFAGCYSFHPRKAITTGEGGMIVTNDDLLAQRIQLLRNHGGVRKELYLEFVEAGYNYRLSDIQGAMGIAQMEKAQKLIEERRVRAEQLREKLRYISQIKLPFDPSWGNHVYQSFVVIVDQSINRDQLLIDMREMGVETSIGTYALHDQPFYQQAFGYKSGALPNSHIAFTQSLTLPLYPQLTDEDLNVISSSLEQALSRQ